MSNVVLQIQHLSKSYGELIAVDDLSLAIYSGEVFGFLGPNGAGKTTAINMICGLLAPDAGQVLLHGRALLSDRRARARVGMCPQDVVLWERLTCIEQLQFIGQMYGLSARLARQRGDMLLAELDLIEKRNRQARTLSGGMKRRLNLAMALVHDPEIVILDEPEAGLDPQSRIKVREYIQSLARSKTIILTTHNMDEAERLADRVAIIDHGKLLVLDTPEALKRSVGEGDVLEMHLAGIDIEHQNIRAVLAGLNHSLNVEIVGDELVVRTLNAVNFLPAILDALSEMGMKPDEVRLRQNTLEDVFIKLTGRRLRQ